METFLIIINVASYFCGFVFFFLNSLMNRKFNYKRLLETGLFFELSKCLFCHF